MIILAVAMWIVTGWFIWDLVFRKDEKKLNAMIAEQDRKHKEFMDNLKAKGIKVKERA